MLRQTMGTNNGFYDKTKAKKQTIQCHRTTKAGANDIAEQQQLGQMIKH